jgi:hypothetical protein
MTTTDTTTDTTRDLTPSIRTAARPLARTRQSLRTAVAGILVLFPELVVGLLLFDAVKATQLRRLDGEDPERGDAIQWVIVTAVGAAIAVTVGAIIYNKLENKANSIDVTTPGAR